MVTIFMKLLGLLFPPVKPIPLVFDHHPYRGIFLDRQYQSNCFGRVIGVTVPDRIGKAFSHGQMNRE